MGQGVGGDPVAAGHRLGGDQRVDDRLLGRLDDGVEQGVDRRSSSARTSASTRRIRLVVVRGSSGCPSRSARNRSPLVWPPVPPIRAMPEARALGEPLALVGQQRRVGRDDDDDRARAGRRHAGEAGIVVGRAVVRARDLGDRDLLADRHAVDPEPARAGRSWPGRGRRPCSRRRLASTTRDAVPIPPLNSWQTIPVPPPTLPSATGPSAAAASAASRCSAVTWKPSMSLSRPSYVSPTTGSDQTRPDGARSTAAATSASRTTPTLWVLVIATGAGQEARLADPLEAGQLAVAVEPVAAGEDGLAPDVAVVRDDDRDAGPDRAAADDERPVAVDRASCGRRGRRATSVIALSGPGRPRPMAIPRSRARIGRRLPCPVCRSRARAGPAAVPIIAAVIHAASARSAAPSPSVRLGRCPTVAAARADRRRRGVPRPARASPCSRAPGPAGTPAGRYLTADPGRGPRGAGRRPRPVRRGAAAAGAARLGRPVVAPAPDAPPFLGGLVGLPRPTTWATARAPAVAAAPPTRTCRCSASRSTTGSSPGTAGPAARGWPAGRSTATGGGWRGGSTRSATRRPTRDPARAGRSWPRRRGGRPRSRRSARRSTGRRTRPASRPSASASPAATSTRPT